MTPLELVKLPAVMQITSGRPDIVVGLIDGPVAMNHPDLAGRNVQQVPGRLAVTCAQASSAACLHGTFVAGILSAKRGSVAPAICPNCTLLVRSIFTETTTGHVPSTTPEELAEAIIEVIEAGAQVINLSVALTQSAVGPQRALELALDYALKRGVIPVAAAGNQGTVGTSVITRHPWTIPVVAYDLQGRPMVESNLGRSIAKRGLGAPGQDITSLGSRGNPLTFGGTSTATPFVTGAVALLWSEFPSATAAEINFAITQNYSSRRHTLAPPLLDAVAAYRMLQGFHHTETTP